jgi:hypothetical protein
MAQSRTAVNAKAGAPEGMAKVPTSVVPGGTSIEDKGGPTNQNYKADNGSAEMSYGDGVSQTNTVINNKAGAASGGMEKLGDNIIPGTKGNDGGRSNEGPDGSVGPNVVPGEQKKPTTTSEHAEIDTTAGEALDELGGDHEASDDFKLKAKVIFEGALNEKLKLEVSRLEEEFSVRFETEITDIAEKVEGFLNYTSQQWLEENKLVVENGIRNELSESFMQGLKGLFEDHYVTLPDEKYDIFESMVAKLDDMEDKLNEQIENNVRLSGNMSEYQRGALLADVSWDLSETAKDKLAGLAESVEFESEESYKQKLNILKESFIGQSEQLNEEVLLGNDEPVVPTISETHGDQMDAYARAIGRTIR